MNRKNMHKNGKKMKNKKKIYMPKDRIEKCTI